ncbi:MAG: YqjF family protein [Bacillota bacterium]
MAEKRNVGPNSLNHGHRLWPLPRLPWVMKQIWENVLFAHYPVKLETLRKLVPEKLPLDTFNGLAWVGIVAVHISNIRLRGLPPIPGITHFSQVNVRTYVTLDGKPGVYFFSLDAGNRLAVETAKIVGNLPYKYSEVAMESTQSNIHFESSRKTGDNANLVFNFKPISKPFHPAKESFEEWVAERYCLYTFSKTGKTLRGDILHLPWLLQQVQAEFYENTLLSSLNIQPESNPPILHYSRQKDVRFWPMVREA